MSATTPSDAWLPAGGIPELFRLRADEYRDRPFLFSWSPDGAWQPHSWAQLAREVERAAGLLHGLGVRRGDRVILAAETRPEWHVADLAIMSLGAITVPLGLLAAAAEWRHILADSEPSAAIVSARARAKFLEADGASRASRIVGLDAADRPEGWLDWSAAPAEPASFTAQLDDVCCLMYTSGTGGLPKGVMLTHRNLLADAVGATEVLADYGLAGHRFLSFLPLAHAYEHTAGFVVPIAIGAELYLSRGPEHLAAELPTARPTMLTVVPRFLEVMQQRIVATVERAPALRRRLFAAARRAGEARFRGEASLADRLVDATAGALVRRQIRARFGDALRCMLCAGAPLPPAVGEFFNGLGVPVHQGYGQTETSPGVTINRRARNRADRVGPPLRGAELRIASDGEILVRGPMVMAGYWRDPAATAAALRDGWLHTGDIGRIDEHGSLAITDRKKDFIKTAGGDMVAPQLVELALQHEPEIAQAAVYGDGQPHLVALVFPAEAAGASPEARFAAVKAAVERANRRLDRAQRIRRFALLDEACSLENQLLTSTLKLRRRELLARHRPTVEALFHP